MSMRDDYVFRSDVIEHGLDREHLVHTDASGVRLDSCGTGDCQCHCPPAPTVPVARADTSSPADPERHQHVLAIRKHPLWQHFDGAEKSDVYIAALAQILTTAMAALDAPDGEDPAAVDPAEQARTDMVERSRVAYLAGDDPAARGEAAVAHVLRERVRRAHAASVAALRAGQRHDDDDDNGGPQAA